MSVKDLFFNTPLSVKDRNPVPWLIDLLSSREPLRSTAEDAPYSNAQLDF